MMTVMRHNFLPRVSTSPTEKIEKFQKKKERNWHLEHFIHQNSSKTHEKYENDGFEYKFFVLRVLVLF